MNIVYTRLKTGGDICIINLKNLGREMLTRHATFFATGSPLKPRERSRESASQIDAILDKRRVNDIAFPGETAA
ncbi:hypothetical protein WN55_01103 [Dufourea novaeangliae]|uniref:Uncharacterized protein n=1 Tax=Dufourea novaeangliae TaxID=178035 RepID=A0A154PG07_DUFNO|nr:hypothetical protein WN55_01103 [Dufourea novaeangliae]